jgi:hypothetical protein
MQPARRDRLKQKNRWISDQYDVYAQVSRQAHNPSPRRLDFSSRGAMPRTYIVQGL